MTPEISITPDSSDISDEELDAIYEAAANRTDISEQEIELMIYRTNKESGY